MTVRQVTVRQVMVTVRQVTVTVRLVTVRGDSSPPHTDPGRCLTRVLSTGSADGRNFPRALPTAIPRPVVGKVLGFP